MHMPLAPGDRLGPYEVVSKLGEGGMGDVWKARDTRLNRFVAVKQLRGEHGARFQREARAVAALNHPHICQIYDIGEDYLVLEFVEGAPLKGPLPREQAWMLARQIASALEAAHAKGILHRDLKPANILVTNSGAKLLDFGLARSVDDPDATQTGGLVGTPLYMSPEQIEGKPLDRRSDIFSFGVVLYEMLLGRRPFDSLASVLRDDPAPSGSDVVTKCLAKEPAHRFDSMTRVLEALGDGDAGPATARPSPQTSIAVLPFVNMSREADDEYFSDGLSEEIINLLAHVPDLKVTARTSAFAFRGKEQDLTRIAEQLRVKTILEGSVRRAGPRIRVTAQLINAADGYHLWSDRFDRELTDVFAIQDEIATAIVGALQLKLGPAHAPRRTPNMAAYEAYLKYRYHQWSFTPEGAVRSRECLEKALALDPDFALFHVGLADHYLSMCFTSTSTADESMLEAREHARRALEFDPDLAEAHAMMGIIAGHRDFDWEACERHFALALAHEPVSTQVLEWYANFHSFPLGRFEDARQRMQVVIDQDPLCQMWHYVLAEILQAMGSYAEALAASRRSVELDPQFWCGWWLMGMQHAVEGRHEAAGEAASKAIALAPWSPFARGLHAGELEREGRIAEARELMAASEADPYSAPMARFCYHVVRGDTESAVEALGQAVDRRFFVVTVIALRPFEPVLRQSAKWPTLLKKANLAACR